MAVFRDGAMAGLRAAEMGVNREDTLFPAVERALDDAGVFVRDLDAVVCGAGPGSFTSLRIAGSIVKGICHAARVPLFPVPSLLLAATQIGVPGRFLVHADALRNERYAMPVHVDHELNATADGPVVRVPIGGLADLAYDRDLVLAKPSVAGLLCVTGWDRASPADLASWEPDYGRLAEAQVKWEASNQRPLHSSSSPV